MKFTRVWDMPNADTFSIPSIEGFVKSYLMHSKVSVDPFARNKRWATHTNDLNPETAAEHHMDEEDFCRMLAAKKVTADLVIFDPPYSLEQIVRTYQKCGIDRDNKGTHNGTLYKRSKDAVRAVTCPGSIVLSFGWNSAGMGKGFEIEQILLVCHGGAHNDTICMAERCIARTPEFYFS